MTEAEELLVEAAAVDEAGIIKRYENVSQVPQHLKKYWSQRYDIFSKFDEGVWLTDDAWFGVTPEPIANTIASHISTHCPPHKSIIIDAFTGAGGNAIAFALSGRWEQIFAIEKDPEVLKCAKHNAEVYGVASKIYFILGDCFKILKTRLKGLAGGENKVVVFGSPPWGGPDYTHDSIFDLSLMEPYTLSDLHAAFTKLSPETVLYLPRNSDLNQLAKYVPGDEQHRTQKAEVIHYCMRAQSKALCVYYGDFTFPERTNSGEDR